MNKLQKDLLKIKKYWNVKTAILLIIILIAAITWFKYVAGLILVAIFAPLCILTTRYAKFVPHVTPESITATTIFMGYLYGISFAALYGFVIGAISLGINSHIKPASLASLFSAIVSGIFCSFLHTSFNFSLAGAFSASMVLRTIIAAPLMNLVGIDIFENITHQISQLFFNLIIYLPLLTALYNIFSPFI